MRTILRPCEPLASTIPAFREVGQTTAGIRNGAGTNRNYYMLFHSADQFASVVAMVAAVTVACSGRAAADTSRPASAASGRIVVLGDSLAVSPSPAQSFPARLQEKLDQQWPGWTIVNAGIRGDTTTGGRRRASALLGKSTRLLIVALG